uniref:Uncharacterized protein n=1 Tax=Panagrolaimus davidi TaxID=227884 RepID=A0A914R0S6_9BILA
MRCVYDSKPSETKPKVKCAQVGQCITGKASDKNGTKNHPTVECSECVEFFCGDDERLMNGRGCLEDFERICTNVPANDMQKIKANRKDYFSYGENYMMASCSYHNNCYEMYRYGMSMPDKFEMLNKWLTKPDKICKYEPLPKSEPSKQDGGGANGIKLSGMFIFGFILLYLL